MANDYAMLDSIKFCTFKIELNKYTRKNKVDCFDDRLEKGQTLVVSKDFKDNIYCVSKFDASNKLIEENRGEASPCYHILFTRGRLYRWLDKEKVLYVNRYKLGDNGKLMVRGREWGVVKYLNESGRLVITHREEDESVFEESVWIFIKINCNKKQLKMFKGYEKLRKFYFD
jgi:hypothetical protein